MPPHGKHENKKLVGDRGAGSLSPDLPRRRRCPCAWWSAGRRRGEWNPKCPLPPAHQPDPHAIRLFFRRRCSRTAVPGPGRGRRPGTWSSSSWELWYRWAEQTSWRRPTGRPVRISRWEWPNGIYGGFMSMPGFYDSIFCLFCATFPVLLKMCPKLITVPSRRLQ